MVLKKSILTFAILMLIGPVAKAEILGFRAWKNQRIEDARLNLDRAQSEASADRQIPSRTLHVRAGASGTRIQRASKGESRLQQAQLNLELATELTINDYFVLYLSQSNGTEAIVEAAKKMSADEVAELMMAYKKRLDSGRSEIGLLPGPTSTPTRL